MKACVANAIATEIFNDCTNPRVGMKKRTSAAARNNRETPRCSLPKAKATRGRYRGVNREGEEEEDDDEGGGRVAVLVMAVVR